MRGGAYNAGHSWRLRVFDINNTEYLSTVQTTASVWAVVPFSWAGATPPKIKRMIIENVENSAGRTGVAFCGFATSSTEMIAVGSLDGSTPPGIDLVKSRQHGLPRQQHDGC